MSDTGSFVKLAKELQHTHKHEVVKVAGILDRIKTLWKKITNPQYREAVSVLQDEVKQTRAQVKEIDKAISVLSSTLANGDLEGYNQQIENVKYLIGQFADELRETDKKAKQVFSWTVKEMYEPGFLSRVTESLPEKYDLEFGKEYENMPLSQFAWYKHINPTVFVRSEGTVNAQSTLIDKTYKVLSAQYTGDEDLRLYFAGENLKAFLEAFEQAIMAGTVLRARPLKPSKDQSATAGQTEIDVKTAPFEVPGLGAVIRAIVVLRDLRTSINEKKRLSLKFTKAVHMVQAPTKLAFAQGGNEIPYNVTRLSEVEFAKVMRAGYNKAFGSDPTAETLAGGWAQAILESGRPVKLPNNNVGNIKATTSWVKSGQPYFVKDTGEYTSTGKYYKERGTKWRAYPTPEDGAAGYWKLLGRRYGRALDWMAAGDPTSASVALGMKNYYTANIRKYSKAVSSIYGEFMRRIAPNLPGLKSSPKAAPGAKPAVKDWHAQYSADEKREILKGDKPKQFATAPMSAPAPTATKPEESGGILASVERLIRKLLASEGVLTTMVKNSILENNLPTSDMLIVVNGSDYSANLEYARVTASLLGKIINAEAEVCSNGDAVEIQCSTLGSEEKVYHAVKALSKMIALSMRSKTGKVVRPAILSGLVSKHGSVECDMLISNRRKFNLNRILNG